MERTKIVTDSTADIPDELVEELEIGIVHDYINFGDKSLRDKLDISRTEFYGRLATADELPTTASPGVGEFEQLYRTMGAPDVSIVSLHPPAHFSALYNTARLAAQAFPEAVVSPLSTGQVSMGLGWLVIAAARAAQDGASTREILDLVRELEPRTRVLAALDTFEFLRRSGRVGWARSLVGTLLRIKPMIEVHAGEINPLDRVRTSSRAKARLTEMTQEMAPLDALAVLHTDWIEGADELLQGLNHLPLKEEILTVDVTPVIGVHVGPKGLGIAAVVTRNR
jgi:DegV family protein with EDD domain